MPTYDFQCRACGEVFEALVPSTTKILPHLHLIDREDPLHPPHMADRLVSCPAGIKMGDGTKARRAKWINEPVWRYPDGHVESLNSKNTRPEE